MAHGRRLKHVMSIAVAAFEQSHSELCHIIVFSKAKENVWISYGMSSAVLATRY